MLTFFSLIHSLSCSHSFFDAYVELLISTKNIATSTTLRKTFKNNIQRRKGEKKIKKKKTILLIEHKRKRFLLFYRCCCCCCCCTFIGIYECFKKGDIEVFRKEFKNTFEKQKKLFLPVWEKLCFYSREAYLKINSVQSVFVFSQFNHGICFKS